MPTSCVVAKCKSRADRDKELKFYRFPRIRKETNFAYKHITNVTELSTTRRVEWIKAVKRDPKHVNYDNSYICSLHFKSGKKKRIKIKTNS